MKKFWCLILMLSLLVACSSEKDVKSNRAPAPPEQTAAAPVAPEAAAGLAGEYVLTETSSKKTKLSGEEYTCQTTHTYTLRFIDSQTVRYTAKTDQSIDPPADNMMCFSKLYNVDTDGTYEIKAGNSVTVTFSPSDEKMPWVDKGVMLLRMKDPNTLEIVYNGSAFRKQ